MACAWYCRRLAVGKGRNVLLWTLLGFGLTVVAVPVLVLLPAPGAKVPGDKTTGGRDSD